MHKICRDNRLKKFKFKLLHNIIATNENLHQMKKASSPLCKKCHLTENYEHFFVSCECIQDFWKIINHIFTLCGYATNFQVLKRRLLFGYKIYQKQYININTILNIISLSIYKSCMASERRLKPYNILKLCIEELSLTTMHQKGNKNKLITKYIEILSQAIHHMP